MKTSRITCLAIVTLLTCGSFARAQSLDHVDHLAVTAERQARQVFYQTLSLRGHGPAAYELRRDAVQMVRLARHIHELAHVDRFDHGRGHHVGACFDRQAHLNRDVADLDRLMHEMQDLAAGLQTGFAVHRPIDDRYGPSHVTVSVGRVFSLNINSQDAGYGHQGASFRAPTELERLEISLAKLAETVHHLLDDTQVVCIRKR